MSLCIDCWFWFTHLKGTIPLLYNRCRYLWGGRSIPCQSGRLFHLFHSNMGATYPFNPPFYFYLALPAVTQFSEWQHSSSGPLSASINGYRCLPSALCMCSFQGPQPSHFTCGLHPSSVDALVDVHSPSCNFPFFHPREALLVGHRVTTLPSCSCGVLLSSPPMEVVLHGVGLVHLSRVWWLPIHKGMPTSDAMRRSQFWWRTRDHPCWFVTS